MTGTIIRHGGVHVVPSLPQVRVDPLTAALATLQRSVELIVDQSGPSWAIRFCVKINKHTPKIMTTHLFKKNESQLLLINMRQRTMVLTNLTFRHFGVKVKPKVQSKCIKMFRRKAFTFFYFYETIFLSHKNP